jgi:hypothetical protein
MLKSADAESFPNTIRVLDWIENGEMEKSNTGYDTDWKNGLGHFVKI